MRLIHRPRFLSKLTPSDPAHYGFNTLQIAWDPERYSLTTLDAMLYPGMDVVLAFVPGKESAVWRNRQLASHAPAFWARWSQGLDAALSALGKRVVAVRWNHEYRPSVFARDAAWRDYVNRRSPGLAQHVLSKRAREFEAAMDGISSGKVQPVHWLESTDRDLGALYQLLVQYQCTLQARVLDEMQAIVAGRGLDLIVYPPNACAFSPRHLPREEYTLDSERIPKDAICELASWDYFDDVWVSESARSVKRKWFYAMQQTKDFLPENVEAAVFHRLHSVNRNEAPPCGFSFWTDWTAGDTAWQQRYMDALRGGLTR